MAFQQADQARARSLYQESLSRAWVVGDRWMLISVLAGVATWLAAQSLPEPALRLAGAVAALHESSGVSVRPDVQAALERGLELARSALPAAAASAAWEQGYTAPLQQVVADARALLAACPPDTTGAEPPPTGGRPNSPTCAPRRPRNPGGLTDREAEVLRLLAHGKTNRQIAADLVVSKYTVMRHISNLYTKLGVSTRAAATAFAVQEGLA